MKLEETLKIEREIVNDISALMVGTLGKYDDQNISRAAISAIFNSALLKYCISHHINIFISHTPFDVIKPEFMSATDKLLDDSYKTFLELNAQ